MDDSAAVSGRPRGTGDGTGNGRAEAIATTGSFDLDPALDPSFDRSGASRVGLWGSGGSKEGASFTVEDVPRTGAGPPSFMASFSVSSNFGGSNSSSLFSGMPLFGPQQPVVMPQQQRSMQNFSSSLGWQNIASLVGGDLQQNLGQQPPQALMHGLSYSSEQVPSSSLGHLTPADENWMSRDCDAIPGCEMSLGGYPSDSEDSTKVERLSLGRKEKRSKGETLEDKFWRRMRGMERIGSSGLFENIDFIQTTRSIPEAQRRLGVTFVSHA